MAAKYPLPTCLVGLVSEAQYRRWLHRRAQAHVKRDRRRRNPEAKVARYKWLIHRAICRDGATDWYTGEKLQWHLIGTYGNDVAKLEGKGLKRRLARMPTVDHEHNGHREPRFRICGWAVNDAKNDLTVFGFLSLCRKVLSHRHL